MTEPIEPSETTREFVTVTREYVTALEKDYAELLEAHEQVTELPNELVPAKLRTFAYGLILTDSVLSALIIGFVALIAPPETALIVTQAVGLIGSAIGSFAGWVGIAYRPTRKYV